MDRNRLLVSLALLTIISLWYSYLFESRPEQQPTLPSASPTSTAAGEPDETTAHWQPVPPSPEQTTAQRKKFSTTGQVYRPFNRAPQFELERDQSLRLDAQTRLEIERLVALTPPEALDTTVTALQASMPAAAGDKLHTLVTQYRAFIDDVRTAFPPNEAPGDMTSALQQLDKVQSLQEQHFGPETASALYGEENRLARGLLQVAQVDEIPGLTPAERERRRADIRAELPELSAMENLNQALGRPAEGDYPAP